MKKSSIMHTEKAVKVLYRIALSKDSNQRALAASLNLSLGGINYRLRKLTEKRWIKVMRDEEADNKFGFIYQLTPKGHAIVKESMVNYYDAKRRESSLLLREIGQLSRYIKQHILS